MKHSKAPIYIAAFVIVFNLALAMAQTNGTNTLPAVPTETTGNNLTTLAIGALVAVSALVTGIIAYLKKKKPPAA